MAEQPKFVEAYNQMVIPHVIAPRNPEDPRLINRIQRHYMAIADALELSHYDTSEYTSITVNLEIIDKRLKVFKQYDELWFEDLQILGGAIRKIGGGVLQSVRLVRYPLNPDTVKAIQAIHEGNDILTREII